MKSKKEKEIEIKGVCSLCGYQYLNLRLHWLLTHGIEKRKVLFVYAVMFTDKILERMTTMDNSKIFNPYCIFKTLKEAKEWRDEKWMGKHEGTDMIKKIQINL